MGDDDGFNSEENALGKKQKKKQVKKRNKVDVGQIREEARAHFSGGYEQVHNHDSDDEHVSDELDTGDDILGSDVEGRPKYIKFKQELMSKDF